MLLARQVGEQASQMSMCVQGHCSLQFKNHQATQSWYQLNFVTHLALKMKNHQIAVLERAAKNERRKYLGFVGWEEPPKNPQFVSLFLSFMVQGPHACALTLSSSRRNKFPPPATEWPYRDDNLREESIYLLLHDLQQRMNFAQHSQEEQPLSPLPKDEICSPLVSALLCQATRRKHSKGSEVPQIFFSAVYPQRHRRGRTATLISHGPI